MLWGVFWGVLTFQYAALIGPNDVPYASLPVLSRRCPSFFPAADMAAADQPPMGARTGTTLSLPRSMWSLTLLPETMEPRAKCME